MLKIGLIIAVPATILSIDPTAVGVAGITTFGVIISAFLGYSAIRMTQSVNLQRENATKTAEIHTMVNSQHDALEQTIADLRATNAKLSEALKEDTNLELIETIQQLRALKGGTNITPGAVETASKAISVDSLIPESKLPAEEQGGNT